VDDWLSLQHLTSRRLFLKTTGVATLALTAPPALAETAAEAAVPPSEHVSLTINGRRFTEASIACVERPAEAMSGLKNGGHLDRQGHSIRKYLEQDQPDHANNGQVIFRSAE
jgi:hypothetical protein